MCNIKHLTKIISAIHSVKNTAGDNILVTISLGGENGNQFLGISRDEKSFGTSGQKTKSADDFYNDFIKTAGADGVDLDFESTPKAGTTGYDEFIFVKALHENHPDTIITMAPQGDNLTGQGHTSDPNYDTFGVANLNIELYEYLLGQTNWRGWVAPQYYNQGSDSNPNASSYKSVTAWASLSDCKTTNGQTTQCPTDTYEALTEHAMQAPTPGVESDTQVKNTINIPMQTLCDHFVIGETTGPNGSHEKYPNKAAMQTMISTFKENYCQPKGFMVWDLDWSAMYDPSWSSDVFNTYNPSSQPAYIGQPSRHSHLSAK